jgi:hypothetical protein
MWQQIAADNMTELNCAANCVVLAIDVSRYVKLQYIYGN